MVAIMAIMSLRHNDQTRRTIHCYADESKRLELRSVQSVFGLLFLNLFLNLVETLQVDNSFIAHGHIAGQPQAKISIRGSTSLYT